MIAVASLVFFLFIISHNYLWVISLPFLFLLFFLYNKKQIWVKLRGLVLVTLLSLGMSSYWLIPALVEKKFVTSITPFPLIDHFPFIKQLILPSWGYGSSAWGAGDEISFQIGIVNLLVFISVALLF